MKTLKQRILSYCMLEVLCCIVPFITAMIFIAITGDRELGLTFSTILSIGLTHFIFSVIFLQTSWLLKLTIPIATTVIAFIGLNYLPPFIHTSFDMYGYWDIVITHSLIAIITWEIVYQLLVVIRKQKTSFITETRFLNFISSRCLRLCCKRYNGYKRTIIFLFAKFYNSVC